jgi:AAHS family 4-hydroxybenzoate transporter-like MFS transporter
MATFIDVVDVIERQTRNRFQIMLMFWVSVAMMIEGFDNQLQSYTAPVIIQEWHLTKTAFGALLGFSQAGFMVGAVTLGHLGDRIGRRVMILAGCLLFGVFTIAGGYAQDLATLAATRVLSFMFLGGAVPNAIALAVEYAPARHRAIRVAIMYVCYTLGAAAGGFISAKIVPEMGWPSIFLLCGWLAVVLSAILYFTLPESARFMVVRDHSREMLAATLRRLSPNMAIPADAVFTARTEKKEKSNVAQLFLGGRAAKTIPLWIACFFSMVALLFLASWMPTILTDSGLPYRDSIIATGIFQAAGSLGTLASGWLLDRRNGILFVGLIALAGASVVVGFPGRHGRCRAPDDPGRDGRVLRHRHAVEPERALGRALPDLHAHHRFGLGLWCRPHRRHPGPQRRQPHRRGPSAVVDDFHDHRHPAGLHRLRDPDPAQAAAQRVARGG